MKNRAAQSRRSILPKSPTSIEGLDEITGGGLPKGRPTLICGGAGCGKTLFAMEFIVRGATLYNEPGVFISFEETENELKSNVASLGFDLDNLIKRNKIWLEHIHVERGEIEQSGEYDLEGLFIRIHHAIESIGARRVVLDTIESLFSELPSPQILRAELRRLFHWLKKRRNDDHYCRTGRRHLNARRPGRICLRLCHFTRPSRDRPVIHTTAAYCQISRFNARYERVSFPD